MSDEQNDPAQPATQPPAAPPAPAAPAPIPEPDHGNERGPVPYERFRQVVTERSAITAQLAEAQARITAAEARAARVVELEAELVRRESDYRDEIALLGAGITDPADRKVARMFYGDLPEADRPAEGIGAWLAAAANSETPLPRALSAILRTETAPKPPPKPNDKANPQPPASGAKMTEDQVRALREQCVKTNNWAPWLAAFPRSGGR